MERNFFLALIFSGLVLYAYQAVFVPPKPPPGHKNIQSIDNKSVTLQNPPVSEVVPEKTETPTTNINKAEDYKLSSTDSTFSFSNVGGSLHKVEFSKQDPLPLTDILSINGLGDLSFIGQQINNNAISFAYKNTDWKIIKTYELKSSNLLDVRMEIKNVGEISNLNSFSFTAYEVDQSRMEINSGNSRNSVLFEYSVYTGNRIFRKGNATKFNEKNNQMGTAPINWVGFRNHYHALIVKPEFKTKSYEIKTDSEKQLNITVSPPSQNLEPGQSVIYDFHVYIGPQDPWLMKTYKEGFEKIVAFSNFTPIEWIAQAIFYAIPILHSIFKSWGVAIILISLFIYGITYPLTLKSMTSMRKMQEVQPKISALREKYKNDPQKLNAEMIEIYRREKINPFGGCLPFLIQMPFFMALYQILWRAEYFQGQGFLWIKDLSLPDRLFILPFSLPFFGNELNILPILTGCIMFLQQRITSKSVVVVDEQQVMQQKMMMYILPVMMTFMFYRFASSWAIYFLVFYILSTATQWKIAQSRIKK